MAMYKGADGKTYYQEDIQCVIDSINDRGGIYIGNLQASQNLKTLKKFNIKGVLTAANGIYLDHPKSQIPHYFYVPAQDKSSFDISKYLDKAADWINSTTKQTNILVHCLAGVSRSVSLVLGYLIKHHGMGYEQAYHKIKSRRKIIHPNDGFIKQLKQYQLKHKDCRIQRSLTGLSPNRKKYMHTISPKRHDSQFQRSYSPSRRYEYMYNGNPQRNKYINCQLETKETFNKPYPEKYQKIDKTAEKSNFIQNYSLRGRTASQHAPKYKNFGRCNNDIKPSGPLNDDLDSKIAQIRKKYLQYTDMHNPLRRSIARDTENKYPAQKRGSFMQNYSLYNNQQNEKMKTLDVRLKKTQFDRTNYLDQNTHTPLRGYTNQLRKMYSDRQY